MAEKDKKFYWLKLKSEFMNGEVVDFLMSQKNGANYVVLYQMLLVKTINTQGKLCTEIGEMLVPYNVDKIQRECKWFDTDTIMVALELYTKLGLVYKDEDGILSIANFEEMVGSETYWAKQKRKQKLQASNDDWKEIGNIPTDVQNPLISNILQSNISISENIDLLSYDRVLLIVKEECPICYDRFQRKVDSGKLEYANRLTQILEDIQGQYDYEAIRKLFRHANKTYITSPNYQQLDLLWVLSNIEKVKATEECDNANYSQTTASNRVTDKTADESNRELEGIFGIVRPEDI